MQSRRWLFLLALPILLGVVFLIIFNSLTRNLPISENNFEGVIFHKDNSAEVLNHTLVNETLEDTYWTPKQIEIVELEAALTDYISDHVPGLLGGLSGYKRQYFGFVRDNKKIIFFSGFCEPAPVDWREKLVSLGMADCYFEGQYDVADRSIIYFWEQRGN